MKEAGKRRLRVAGGLNKQLGGKVAAAAAAVAGGAAGSLAVGTAAAGCYCQWEPHLQSVIHEMSKPRQMGAMTVRDPWMRSL